MRGERVTLEPLDPTAHEAALYAAGHDDGDPRLWDHLPVGPFTREAFTPWLAACAASEDPQFYAVRDVGGVAQGMCSFLRIVPEHGVIEIGHIWFGPALQRTAAATEAIYLLARRAFDELGYRRLEWKTNALNERSRRAAQRFGFAFEGVFRHHMVVKGHNRDTAWFALVDDDWPAARRAFERWLAPENFDGEGRQRASLESVRQSG